MPEDWLSEIAAEIKIGDLPESYQAVAEIVGVRNTLKLAGYLGGQEYYFRKLDGIYRAKRDAGIRQEFTGVNHKELARKYNLSEVQIRSILRGPEQETADLFPEGL